MYEFRRSKKFYRIRASLLHFTVKENAPDWISGGAFGIEGSLISIFVLLAAIIYLLWLIKTEETD